MAGGVPAFSFKRTAMANDWEISRTTGRCAATGRELAEGEFYYTALFETPQGFERRDFSVESWSGPPEGCFCYWKTRVPTREKKRSTIAVDNALLVSLFTRLEDDSSEMRQKFRFVLALLLMRKRLLRMENSVHEDDREYWQMRLTAEQSVHRVLNPNLSPDEIDRLSAQLTAILSGDSSAISAMEEDAAELESTAPAEDMVCQAGSPADQTPGGEPPDLDKENNRAPE
jgi:hypothetical protein